ncbi:MAG: metallophosphoesterase [Lachnospiraceae bacterium]|nr:metallophosphoesterase [Lachnospiraceae bacterium]
MNYYISDLHLFHKNVTGDGNNFDGRPYETLAEMHEDIRNRWNQKITNGDTVYILGDVSLRGRKEELIAFVSTLKGHKVLVRGNHDDTSDLRYQNVYDEICDYKEITDRLLDETVHLVLSHYPILMWKNQHRGWILLYGHLHQSGEDRYFQKVIAEMNREDFEARVPRSTPISAHNVGCMLPYMDFEPRTLEEIVKGSYKYMEVLGLYS